MEAAPKECNGIFLFLTASGDVVTMVARRKQGGMGSTEGEAMPRTVLVIGGGLAGCEAAWQAAQRGIQVRLYEMRPLRMTPAHRTDRLAELVCSNSLGSNLPNRALGLLKDELRRLGSLLISCADATCVPAGDALAVGRDAFSEAVTSAIEAHPRIEVIREEVLSLPSEQVTVIATGPLTSSELAEQLRTLAGQAHLHFFDAMAPIVAGDSIDMNVAFKASRWSRWRRNPDGVAETEASGSADYINCPLNKEDYYDFVDALNHADKTSIHEPAEPETAPRYFEACLPIEVLAARSRDALAFGPMRPVGLIDPRTGRRPYATVQLRQDNLSATLYNMVGFQTNLRWAEQERILRMIPGLEHADFVRFGQMHRNTFINSPVLLRPTLQWKGRDHLLFAGQLTGTEGYVGSIAGGLLAGINAVRIVEGRAPVVCPETTMIGALFHYITHAEPGTFQPMKANFGLLPSLGVQIRDRQRRGSAYAERSGTDLKALVRSIGSLAESDQ
jgi:methylenetetrahydrofolate--tRNA-(uracil-5-)-methyltransferase